VSEVVDAESADFLYCVTDTVAVAPSDDVTVIVLVRSAEVLVYAAAVTVTVVPDAETVSQLSADGAVAVKVAPVESPDTVNVFAIFCLLLMGDYLVYWFIGLLV
jgi:hypothetical protein